MKCESLPNRGLVRFNRGESILIAHIYFLNDSNKSGVVLIKGYFPGLRNNQPIRAFAGRIKNGDIVTLGQSQKNASMKTSDRKMAIRMDLQK